MNAQNTHSILDFMYSSDAVALISTPAVTCKNERFAGQTPGANR